MDGEIEIETHTLAGDAMREVGLVSSRHVPLSLTVSAPQQRQRPAPALFTETIPAAGTIANWPYRSVRYLENRDGVQTDPDHNPYDMIKGTKYESDPARFAYARNEQETRAIMSEWDADDDAQEVLARSGTSGVVAAVGMGLIDPTIFLPVAKVFTGVKQGYSALRISGDVALSAGATAAVGEGAMALTTPGYDIGDVAFGIGSATILGGLLGGAAGVVLSRTEKAEFIKRLDLERAEWAQDVSTQASSAGAAATDTRQLTMNTPSLLKKLPDPIGKIAPTRRVMNSSLVSTRRAAADLVETPYIFRENIDGVATTQGPALDRLAKMETGKAKVALSKQFDNAYSRYRFGREPQGLTQRIGQKVTRLGDHLGRPSEKLTHAQFREAVDDALRSGDDHAIPEVAETARMIRSTVLDPWRDRAIKAGLLPEGVDAQTADSYMTRIWNKQALIGERPKALQIFADWLQGEEVKKAGLQERLTGLSSEIDIVNGKIKALEAAKVKKLGHDAELIDLTRDFDRLRARIEDAVNQWDGRSAKAAQSAIKRRPDPKGEARLKEADGDVDAAVRRILSKPRRTDRKDAEALAQEVISRIVGTPDGRLPYDAPSGRSEFQGGETNPDARGALAARTFMIPDELVRDFIDKDAFNTAHIYLNTMIPDVLLTERFGDIRMTDALKKIQDEAATAMTAAKTPKEREAINVQVKADIADVAAMRDRIRHVYGYSSDPRQQFMGRMAATAARYDIMTNLGGVTLSSMADLAGIQWRYGLQSAFRHAWKPYIKALTDPKARQALMQYRSQMQSLGIAAETFLNTRTSALHDVMDAYRPTSRFERGIAEATDKFGVVNGLSLWTDFGKLAAGMTSASEISGAAKAVSEGKAKPRQIRDLAENGIDAAMAQRIHDMMRAPGGADEVSGLMIPNSGAWKDRGAAEAFEGAIGRDVDIMIITPGAEKPLAMSRPVAALVLQYKSFVAAANERLLVRSLQARDRQVLHGLVSAIALGILAEYASNFFSGRESPKTAADMIKAGITRSGSLGWYAEGNAVLSKWTGGTTDAFRLIGTSRPDSRYVSRSALGAVLGPTAGKFENLITIGRDAINGDWTSMDTERLRRFMIGQNLFYIRGLFDRLVDGANEGMGLDALERAKPAG
ncbi:MAG: hypothetical protein ACRCU5_13840 [Rhizobiaceae bacterium]